MSEEVITRVRTWAPHAGLAHDNVDSLSNLIASRNSQPEIIIDATPE
jgi:hypothetical protein